MSRDILAEITASAFDKVGKDYKVYAKTNIGPAFPLYTGPSSGKGLISALGIEGGIVITDKNGTVITTLGNPAPTNWLKAALVWGVAGYILATLGRGLIK
ncbi:hypothetical protein [Zhongshania sp. BJYM1]|uniref:hypothetical protein n=1 Tax=Zhongshania aquatica TaxID=2965069 RepID=UPI0022B58558|nr:hypothetical protein [Marortus sp. BJYM1]